MDLIIKGFTSQEQMQQFADWYCGQGEQGFSDYLSFRDETNLKYANSRSTKVEGDNLIMTVEAVEG